MCFLCSRRMMRQRGLSFTDSAVAKLSPSCRITTSLAGVSRQESTLAAGALGFGVHQREVEMSPIVSTSTCLDSSS